MGYLPVYLGPLVVQLPAIVVMVVGLVLLGVRRPVLGRRQAGLAIAGCAMLLAATLVGVAWIGSFPVLVSEGVLEVGSLSILSAGTGLLLALVQAVGVGLLIGAVLAADRPIGDGRPGYPTRPVR